MDEILVRAKLAEVLQQIQASSEEDCPAILGSTRPLEDLPEFNSKIWPIATAMLAAALGITIDNDVNIFRKKKECVSLTIDETVALVMEIAEKQFFTEKQVVNSK